MSLKNPDNVYVSISECPICASKDLAPVLDLGEQPPANSLRENLNESLPSIPLRISRCNDCSGIVLAEQVNPEYLFNHYVWVTGTSLAVHGYSDEFYQQMIARTGEKKLFVIEVASNDGTFLKRFKAKGHEVLGIDPAQNIAQLAVAEGIPTVADFFGQKVAQNIVSKHGQADVVFARNVIPHVKNIHDVISGMSTCLKADGIGCIEFHYSKVILDELHYDSIYHEHVYYYSLRSMSHLLAKHELFPFDVSESPISGGSLVLYFTKSKKQKTTTLNEKIMLENDLGVNQLKTWLNFAEKSKQHAKKLKDIVSSYSNKGPIVGYGASARSSTVLNFCGINNKMLSCIADQNKLKQNLYTPGSDIPILSVDEAMSKKPSTILLLAWNFKDEILNNLRQKYGFNGDVIIPFPGDPKVITLK